MAGIETCAKCGRLYVGKTCPNCIAISAASSHALRPGDIFRGFEILEVLGEGSMTTVYKGRHAVEGRLVAVKTLRLSGLGYPELGERLDREGRTLAALSHPNIVRCHEFGEEGDLLFLAVEYVDGVTLRRILEGRRLSRDEVLRVMAQICDALQYAHGMGVVHRDIKPENILVAGDGTVKVADFGLLKLLGPMASPTAHEMPLTATEDHLGTAGYMAPEQLGDAKSVDHRADIYAAGAVLYELLTGEVPGEKAEPPSRKVDVHPFLEQAVMKALAKDPAARYQSAADFKRDLLRMTR